MQIRHTANRRNGHAAESASLRLAKSSVAFVEEGFILKVIVLLFLFGGMTCYYTVHFIEYTKKAVALIRNGQ